jgi:hypothetical protein
MSEHALNSQTFAALSATRTLLRCGVIAGPLFLLVFALQIPLRPEFHFTRSEPSSLSLGPLGFIQIVNFALGGSLVFAGALGMRRLLRGSKGGLWAPLLMLVFAAGQVGVGLFVVDPASSAPPSSLHGTLHVVCGAISFLALMLSSFVFVRVFFAQRQKAWALFCAVTGLLLLSAFVSAGRAQQSGANIQTFLNVICVFQWIAVSLIASRLLRNLTKPLEI